MRQIWQKSAMLSWAGKVSKFKIDENLPCEVSDLFNAEGHDSLTVNEQNLGGCHDRDLISICGKEKRILVTLDFDFSDIRVYPPQKHHGIVIFKSVDQSKKMVLKLAKIFLSVLKKEPVQKSLWIVEVDRVRIRT